MKTSDGRRARYKRSTRQLDEGVPMHRCVLKAAFAVAASVLLGTATAKEMPVVDPAELIARFGKPDNTRSSEHEKPRPPFVTKMLEYKKEKVRIVLLANAPVGSPPPYNSWNLMGFQDMTDNSVLTQEEGERRLATRKRK